MEKLNNKGFAISGIIYSLLLLFIILLTAILLLIANRKFVLDTVNKDIMKKLDETEKENTNDIENDLTFYFDHELGYQSPQFIDLSGNGNVITGNGISRSYDGVQLYGDASYINTGLSNYNNNNYSFMIRFKINSTSFTLAQTIMGDSNSSGAALRFPGTGSPKIEFTIFDESSGNFVNIVSSFNLDINVFYTVVGTYDGNTLKLYINGKLESFRISTGGQKDSDLPVYIGRNPISDTTTLGKANTICAYAKVFNRALTAKEIDDMYNSDKIRFGL
jgi:hypothetical protein